MSQNLTLSYCQGSTEIPLQFWRCFDRLPHWVEKTPDKDIVVFRQPNSPRQAISFGEFHRHTDGIANYLIRSHPDLRVGDNVLLLGPNGLDYCLVMTGLNKAGFGLVKLHPQNEQDLKKWAERTRVKAVVYQADGVFQTAAEWFRDLMSIRIDFDTLIRSGRDSDSDAPELLRQRQAQISADYTFAFYPTSGTTGKPKLVPHSHYSIVNSVRFRAISALLTSEDIFFSDRATAHIVGDFGLLTAMLQGLTLVVTPCSVFAGDRGAKNAAWMLSMLAEERVTSGDFFGYILHDIVNKAGNSAPECLRSPLVAGSMTTSQQMERAMTVLPGLANYYGTTETAMITAPAGPAEDSRARRDTVGRPALHMEVVVVEPGSQDALPVPIGNIGEIWTRGFSVMRGYHDDPERTKEALNEAGWYRTGDVGYIDANGRVTVTGRIKDLIMRATVNVIPSGIEQVLQAHPDVQAVQVLGVPDDRYGEEIAACVVLKPERRGRLPELKMAHELANWCRDQGLVENRDGLSDVPRYWAFLDDFPTTRVGKVVKSEVREHVTCGRGFIDGLEFLISS